MDFHFHIRTSTYTEKPRFFTLCRRPSRVNYWPCFYMRPYKEIVAVLPSGAIALAATEENYRVLITGDHQLCQRWLWLFWLNCESSSFTGSLVEKWSRKKTKQCAVLWGSYNGQKPRHHYNISSLEKKKKQRFMQLGRREDPLMLLLHSAGQKHRCWFACLLAWPVCDVSHWPPNDLRPSEYCASLENPTRTRQHGTD